MIWIYYPELLSLLTISGFFPFLAQSHKLIKNENPLTELIYYILPSNFLDSITSYNPSFSRDEHPFLPGILIMFLIFDPPCSPPHQYKIQSLSGHTIKNPSKTPTVSTDEQVPTAHHLVLQFNLILYRGFHLIKNLEGLQEKPSQQPSRKWRNAFSVALLHLPQPNGSETEGISPWETDVLNSKHKYVETNLINLYCPTPDYNSTLHRWRTIPTPCLRGFLEWSKTIHVAETFKEQCSGHYFKKY